MTYKPDVGLQLGKVGGILIFQLIWNPIEPNPDIVSITT